MDKRPRYNPISAYLREVFGARVRKVPIYAGFTCPNRDGTKGFGGCIFCNDAVLIPDGVTPSTGVLDQIDRGIKRLSAGRDSSRFIAYFQINSNTYGRIERLAALYNEALSHPSVSGLVVSTRPDCVGDDVLDLLADVAGKRLLWLELGLQSANTATLEYINRGHTAGEFADAVERARQRGIKVCVHLILGLPGEGRDEALETIRFVSGQGVWGVKFHQLDVVRNTRLEGLYENGVIRLLGLEEYSSLVVECLERLGPDVVIHRLSGVTPRGLLVAPGWGANKFMVKEAVERLLVERDTRQGALFRR